MKFDTVRKNFNSNSQIEKEFNLPFDIERGKKIICIHNIILRDDLEELKQCTIEIDGKNWNWFRYNHILPLLALDKEDKNAIEITEFDLPKIKISVKIPDEIKQKLSSVMFAFQYYSDNVNEYRLGNDV